MTFEFSLLSFAMRRICLTLLLLGLSTPAAANVQHFAVNKRNEAKSNLRFSLSKTKMHGQVQFSFRIKENQSPHRPVWRIEYWHIRKGKVVISIPVATKTVGDDLVGTVTLRPSMLRGAMIAVRVGEFAPKLEQIYRIDLNSYR